MQELHTAEGAGGGRKNGVACGDCAIGYLPQTHTKVMGIW